VVDDISHEGLRTLLRQEGVSFQQLKPGRPPKDPWYAAKKARIEHLYAIADREITPGATTRESSSALMSSGRSTCNRARDGTGLRSATGRKSPARRRAAGCARPIPASRGSGTYSPPTSWARTSCSGTSSRARPGPGSWSSAATCAPLYPLSTRIAIICDNFSPHLSTRKDRRVGTWATANVEIAYTLSGGSFSESFSAGSVLYIRTVRCPARLAGATVPSPGQELKGNGFAAFMVVHAARPTARADRCEPGRSAHRLRVRVKSAYQ